MAHSVSKVFYREIKGGDDLGNWSPGRLRWYREHEPELYWADQFPWQLYVHLSFRKARLPEHARGTYLHMWLRNLARGCRIHFRDELCHLFRLELAPCTGRQHLHGLIGGLPKGVDLQKLCESLRADWTRHTGGFALVQRYRSTLQGTAYVLKREKIQAHLRRVDSDQCAPKLSPAFCRFVEQL